MSAGVQDEDQRDGAGVNVAVVLCLMQIGLAIVATLWTTFSMMSFGRCESAGSTCDQDLGGTMILAFRMGTGAFTVAAIVGTGILAYKKKSPWRWPLCVLVLQALLTATTLGVIDFASR